MHPTPYCIHSLASISEGYIPIRGDVVPTHRLVCSLLTTLQNMRRHDFHMPCHSLLESAAPHAQYEVVWTSRTSSYAPLISLQNTRRHGPHMPCCSHLASAAPRAQYEVVWTSYSRTLPSCGLTEYEAAWSPHAASFLPCAQYEVAWTSHTSSFVVHSLPKHPAQFEAAWK